MTLTPSGSGLMWSFYGVKLNYNLDVLFVSEVEIKPETHLPLYNIPGYKHGIAGTLNSRKHARSSAYFKSNLNLTPTLFDSEVICLSSSSIILVGGYRQFKLWPGQTHISELQKIIDILESLNSNKLDHLGGGRFQHRLG